MFGCMPDSSLECPPFARTRREEVPSHHALRASANHALERGRQEGYDAGYNAAVRHSGAIERFKKFIGRDKKQPAKSRTETPSKPKPKPKPKTNCSSIPKAKQSKQSSKAPQLKPVLRRTSRDQRINSDVREKYLYHKTKADGYSQLRRSLSPKMSNQYVRFSEDIRTEDSGEYHSDRENDEYSYNRDCSILEVRFPSNSGTNTYLSAPSVRRERATATPSHPSAAQEAMRREKVRREPVSERRERKRHDGEDNTRGGHGYVEEYKQGDHGWDGEQRGTGIRDEGSSKLQAWVDSVSKYLLPGREDRRHYWQSVPKNYGKPGRPIMEERIWW